jgi:hypothetical protein
MATEERIRRDIEAIAGRPKAVAFEEIQRIVNQLALVGYSTSHRKTNESHLFRVEDQRFGVSDHNPGSAHVKACYVKAFLVAMINLGLYEE